MGKALDAIFEYTCSLDIIDTHEHLPCFEKNRDQHTDFLKEYLLHYFKCDLVSAGLSQEALVRVADPDQPLQERWALVAPYWDAARHTGYGQCIDVAVSGLYGIDGVNGDTVDAVQDAFAKSLGPGHFEYVLKEKSKVRVSLLDVGVLHSDQDFFRNIHRLDSYIMPGPGAVPRAEEILGTRVHSFGDWLDACEADLDHALAEGAVALKSGLAYSRPLRYERRTRHEAEEDFNRLLMHRPHGQWREVEVLSCPCLQDYMMHHVLRLAGRRGLTYQFHTGLQEGNGNHVRYTDPTQMTNLFLEYPDVDFDIFHIGYPYHDALSALCKNFPNVFIDMCWAHIISPVASVNALDEWLEAVPANKISAFGGDFCFIDGVYGHQHLARRNVSEALARKVRTGLFDVDRACQIARMLFVDNPMRIFKLDGTV